MFVRGQIVQHPNRPEWGPGTVLEMNGQDKVRVQFQDGTIRLLNTGYVTLELVDGPSSRPSTGYDFLEPLTNVDMSRVRTACESFISRMENRRSNTDDAGVARLVLREMETRGRLTLTTFKTVGEMVSHGRFTHMVSQQDGLTALR